ncbi:hypothetical protein ACWEVP_35825 [Amycolatopsis sp. NPDC003865]
MPEPDLPRGTAAVNRAITRLRLKRLFTGSRPWYLLAGAAGAVLVLIGTRAWLGPDDWAGLGQWVGGLGAFYAAWAALRIARDEVGRESQREAERQRVHAYFVSGSWVYSDTSHVGAHYECGEAVETDWLVTQTPSFGAGFRTL